MPLINLGRVDRGVEMLVVGCAVIFMAKKETKMLPFDVAQRSQHFRFFFYLKIILLVRKLHIFHAPAHAPEIY